MCATLIACRRKSYRGSGLYRDTSPGWRNTASVRSAFLLVSDAGQQLTRPHVHRCRVAMIPHLPFRSSHVRVICGSSTLCVLLAFSAQAADVLAFTDAQHPLSHTEGSRVVLLDAPVSMEAKLGAQLPANSARAEAIVRQRLVLGGADLQRRLAVAFQGVADAWGLGITKIPAVVVDRHYVVYGEPNVSRAVERVRAYQVTQP